ncbi:hypothetical protein BD410DRAFT_805426 [Rickenella mellea]|uniref:Uncharacterized protein n=1 Tax=Rickenella mellea TaxID=50990 RepID=A0A4Y7PXV3_9AGAM|nr:hypothetical protein BD410DRAFT_805426 [Rickenella mellea]
MTSMDHVAVLQSLTKFPTLPGIWGSDADIAWTVKVVQNILDTANIISCRAHAVQELLENPLATPAHGLLRQTAEKLGYASMIAIMELCYYNYGADPYCGVDYIEKDPNSLNWKIWWDHGP